MKGEIMLVYEYMSCGTLADHLYKLAGKNNAYHLLSWKQRLQICIGAGRGLDYLHTGNGIIHRDVKASNILLDEKFVAKVSDFGLAKTGSGSDSQSQASTNLKGTFGYIDPDYFRTRKLTTKSDVYSFGVVLLEVLCGRQAVEPWVAEERRSLTMWAQDNISKGQVEKIVTPALREEVSPDSLKTFVRIAGKCLLDEPKKRPAMTRVVLKLEFALEQQENAESLAPKERAILSDIFPSTDKPQKENKNEITDLVDPMPYTNQKQQEKPKSLSANENSSPADALPADDRTILSVSRRQTATSSNLQNTTSLPREQTNSNMINSGNRDERKSMVHRLSRKLWPWDALWKPGKSPKKKNLVSHALSAPIAHRTSIQTMSAGVTVLEKRTGGSNELIPMPILRAFYFEELKAATRNFNRDTFLGEGGFGPVYKGWIHHQDTLFHAEEGIKIMVAIKKLNSKSLQGLKEWQNEVNFLGRISHPNLVKLLGYCWEKKELLLVYEFLHNGSLDNHLFGRGLSVQPLSWDMRLYILIGAAKGLAFLHTSDRQAIYRDFKSSNILLDSSYNAKLSDFGLARMGPTAGYSHVTTQVMGTYGYAAPEYIATGHLYVKSDVYGFGVVLVEMLTGLRALDTNRPSGQHNLVDWIKPHLSERRKLKHIIDTRLEGIFPSRSALQIAHLARSCLENDPKNRPSMQEVVETLERIDAAGVEKLRQPRVHFSQHVAERYL